MILMHIKVWEPLHPHGALSPKAGEVDFGARLALHSQKQTTKLDHLWKEWGLTLTVQMDFWVK